MPLPLSPPPPPPPSPGRLRWADVPAPLRARLEAALGGAVAEVRTPEGGFGHQLAAVLLLDNGRRFFVKAAPDEDPLTVGNLHEAAVLGALPPRTPAPALVGVHHRAGWTAVVVAHLDGPHPDLSPHSGDAGVVRDLLAELTADPAPAAYREAVGSAPSGTARLHGWDVLLADPPDDLPVELRALLPLLAAVEARWPSSSGGDRIVHGDLRADNMVRDRFRGVMFVDWAHATTGPACVDAVSLAPQPGRVSKVPPVRRRPARTLAALSGSPRYIQYRGDPPPCDRTHRTPPDPPYGRTTPLSTHDLVLAGHEPATVAKLLDESPAAAADPEATTAFLAALCGHCHLNARMPAPPGAPGLRPYQRRAAAAGLAVLLHRLRR